MRVKNNFFNTKKLRLSGVCLAIVLAGTGCENSDDIPIAERFVAKNICSGLYVSHYPYDTLVNNYTFRFIGSLSQFLRVTVNDSTQTVHVNDTVFGERFSADAFYRPPIGCVLRYNDNETNLKTTVPQYLLPPPLSNKPWPSGDGGLAKNKIDTVNYQGLDSFSSLLFANQYDFTTAFLVIYKGQLIYEKYAPGLNEKTQIKGFSFAKSTMNSIVGLMQRDQLINIEDEADYPAWNNSAKANITVKNLLQMNSGLEHHEMPFGKNDDVGQMFYNSPHPADFAGSKNLAYTPGDYFNYSSGDTAILSEIVQNKLGGMNATNAYIQHNLFFPARITSAFFEYDTKNYINGSEAAFMTAQDWARLGWLYVNGGRINDTQILPEKWVNYSLSPSSASLDYGSSIDLNTTQTKFPSLPADTFLIKGAFGQNMIGIPSRQILIVRLGFTYTIWGFDEDKFASQVLANFPE